MNHFDIPQGRPQPISLRQTFWYWLRLGFLPSFLFFLAGGPLLESTHGNR
ncbi:MAG: hypothetical protein PHE55_00025 [Methylococcaceae bacterium]|nr:hypothetical protein [Methylococcaceae bacterium]